MKRQLLASRLKRCALHLVSAAVHRWHLVSPSRCLFIGFSPLVITACAGINLTPEDYLPIYSPSIKGTLLSNDQPMTDVEIVLAPVTGPAAQCYFEKRSVRTDASGRFSINALSADEAGDLALETEYRWQVCIKDSTGNRPIWYDSITGRLSQNASVELACDLVKKSQADSICKRVDTAKIDLDWPESGT